MGDPVGMGKRQAQPSPAAERLADHGGSIDAFLIQDGQDVIATGKPHNAHVAFLSKGAQASVVVNFRIFVRMSPRVQVRSIYSALRGLSAEGTKIPHQFKGFYDELELFGLGSQAEDYHLAQALERAEQVELPFQVSPLEAASGDDEETKH